MNLQEEHSLTQDNPVQVLTSRAFIKNNTISRPVSYQIKNIAIHRLASFCLLGMNFLFALVSIWPCKHKMGNEGFVEKH